MSTAETPLLPETAIKAAKRLFRRKGREVIVWHDHLANSPRRYTICTDAEPTVPVGTITTETFEVLKQAGYVQEHGTLVSTRGVKVYQFSKNAVLGLS